MYLYLGQNAAVRGEDIIGIFDLDNTTVSKHTRNMLNRAEKENNVETITWDIPKAFVVCASSRKEEPFEKIYLTQMAPATLRKRVQTYSYDK